MAPKSKTKPSVLTRNRRSLLERKAFELSRHCPVDRTNPSDCPLCGLRPLPARERKGWLQQLSDDDLEYLATYHGTCFAEKMGQGER